MSESLDTRGFRDAIGQFATGVCVVTALTAEATPTGMTANAFSSLSLDPLLVIVCFDRTSRTLTAAQASRRVAVNVLAAGQEELAARFASKAGEREKFEGVPWTERDGVPVLDGVVSWFTGTVSELVPGGDHEIGVVAVDDFGSPGGEPLLYHRGSYARMLGPTP